MHLLQFDSDEQAALLKRVDASLGAGTVRAHLKNKEKDGGDGGDGDLASIAHPKESTVTLTSSFGLTFLSLLLLHLFFFFFFFFKVVHKGLVDDERNTDNSWVETSVLHFHETTPGQWQLALTPGESAIDAHWADAETVMNSMYASHGTYIKMALDKLRSAGVQPLRRGSSVRAAAANLNQLEQQRARERAQQEEQERERRRQQAEAEAAEQARRAREEEQRREREEREERERQQRIAKARQDELDRERREQERRASLAQQKEQFLAQQAAAAAPPKSPAAPQPDTPRREIVVGTFEVKYLGAAMAAQSGGDAAITGCVNAVKARKGSDSHDAIIILHGLVVFFFG